MIKLISPAKDATVSILTPVQKKFLELYGMPRPEIKGIEEEDSYPVIMPIKSSIYDTSAPASVMLSWVVDDITLPVSVDFSLSEDFPEDDSFIGTRGNIYFSAEEPNAFQLRLDNLLPGKKYYWRVRSDNDVAVSSFTTEKSAFRPIRLEGTTNVRDMGGRFTEDGREIKTNLVFRGAELDLAVKTCARSILKKDMKIKTDIDLRHEAASDGITVSPLGENANYVLHPINAYGGTLNDGGRADLREILETFADEANYPIYFHCVVGADRTGTIGMYLDAILGMSDNDIVANYNFTSMGRELIRCFDTTSDCLGFFDYLEETYPELTLRERILTNLMLSGISEETLDKIRGIMLV